MVCYSRLPLVNALPLFHPLDTVLRCNEAAWGYTGGSIFNANQYLRLHFQFTKRNVRYWSDLTAHAVSNSEEDMHIHHIMLTNTQGLGNPRAFMCTLGGHTDCTGSISILVCEAIPSQKPAQPLQVLEQHDTMYSTVSSWNSPPKGKIRFQRASSTYTEVTWPHAWK